MCMCSRYYILVGVNILMTHHLTHSPVLNNYPTRTLNDPLTIQQKVFLDKLPLEHEEHSTARMFAGYIGLMPTMPMLIGPPSFPHFNFVAIICQRGDRPTILESHRDLIIWKPKSKWLFIISPIQMALNMFESHSNCLRIPSQPP